MAEVQVTSVPYLVFTIELDRRASWLAPAGMKSLEWLPLPDFIPFSISGAIAAEALGFILLSALELA